MTVIIVHSLVRLGRCYDHGYLPCLGNSLVARTKREEIAKMSFPFSLSLVWNINSKHILTGPVALPASIFWMAEYSSSVRKSSEKPMSMLHTHHLS